MAMRIFPVIPMSEAKRNLFACMRFLPAVEMTPKGAVARTKITQASRLHLETQTSFRAERSGGAE